jgi:tetratricopeptide (TPR) repeat protein
MKSNYLHKIVFVGILIISTISYCQNINIEEERDLEFQTHFFEALKQSAIKNYSKAIERLEKCNQIDSSSLAVKFEFSKNYLLNKNFFEAEIFIDKALSKESNNPYLLAHKVAIFKAQKAFEKAISIQKKLVEIKPVYGDELVLLYIQNQNFVEAEKLVSEIEENGLKTLEINEYKEFLEKRKTVNNSLENQVENSDLETLKKLYSENKEFSVLQKLIKKEENLNLFSLLYEDSGKALELFPTQPFLYLMNALALNKLGKYKEAITVLTIGIDFVIEDNEMEADYYEQFSISYMGLGNNNDALKYKQRIEQLRN